MEQEIRSAILVVEMEPCHVNRVVTEQEYIEITVKAAYALDVGAPVKQFVHHAMEQEARNVRHVMVEERFKYGTEYT